MLHSAEYHDPGHPQTTEVSRPSCEGSDREVVSALLGEALVLLEQDRAAARRYIESARSLMRTPVTGVRTKKYVLADWQVRRATEFISSNLGTSLRIEATATLVHLSASYFSRAFKSTTGVCYSDFVMGARVNLAKRLLLTSDVPIAEVAVICGLADQSHLTRVFRRAVGLPPKAWRRQVLAASS